MATLHVTNGDSAAGTLRTFLDPVLATKDVLHDGPAPQVDLDAWHDIRARFLASYESATFDRIRRDLADVDRTIVGPGYDEVVLWFEHDLYDQLLLIRTLDLLTPSQPSHVSLICIDRFPGVNRFVGLGQLSAEQLATLVDSRRPVTPEQFAQASQAWRAFQSDDPTALATGVADAALPFLRPALKRFLEEYPWTTNGLSRTANAALRALDARSLDGGELFMATQDTEEAPFMGDWGFFDVVRMLARGRVPLVTVSPSDAPVDLRHHTVAITGAGRDVLEGRRDAVALNGIDMWRGGVHLTNGHVRRWHAATQSLVSFDESRDA